jgi:ABC-type glycerol-3-phosphate transport system permease component
MIGKVARYGLAIAISAIFVYPFYWMVVAAFRSRQEILSDPLRLLPERFDLSGFAALSKVGGVTIWSYSINSIVITVLATIVGVITTGLGAYAFYRQQDNVVFRVIRLTFLLKIMYPSMLLVIPLYFVAFQLGLLGTLTGIVLVMSIQPLVFFMFVEFFRTIPIDLIEAAKIDGASEFAILRLVVAPMARPIVVTCILVSFLLTWKEWFPVVVLSTRSSSYTLPVGLLFFSSEIGVDFQAIMALATLTTVPVLVLFVLTQRRVMSGFLAGALKG